MTAVTSMEMRAVDHVAVEDVGLQVLQMMENAGRVLAWHVRAVHDGRGDVLVVAGNGGNGGGGLVCVRHLANRGIPVKILLDRPVEELTGATAQQQRVLSEMGISTTSDAASSVTSNEPSVIVDALIGYGLTGNVRPTASSYVELMNTQGDSIVSLDVPSGREATTGESLGAAVRPDRTVTLALPKVGLTAVPGPLFLADIGIPATVYDRLDIEYENVFGDRDWIELAS